MLVDLGQKLIIPPEIITTSLRPNMILWSTAQKSLYLCIVELTVPWEAAVDEAYERKRLKYADIAADAEQHGWHTKVLPVEVGCRWFVATSTTRLLKRMGVRGQAFRQAIRSVVNCQLGSQLLPSKAATGFGCKMTSKRGKTRRGAHLGRWVLLLSPLEVSWAYQRNTNAHLMTPMMCNILSPLKTSRKCRLILGIVTSSHMSSSLNTKCI